MKRRKYRKRGSEWPIGKNKEVFVFINTSLSFYLNPDVATCKKVQYMDGGKKLYHCLVLHRWVQFTTIWRLWFIRSGMAVHTSDIGQICKKVQYMDEVEKLYNCVSSFDVLPIICPALQYTHTRLTLGSLNVQTKTIRNFH